MVLVSLFNGIDGAYQSLRLAGIPVHCEFWAEIDGDAQRVTRTRAQRAGMHPLTLIGGRTGDAWKISAQEREAIVRSAGGGRTIVFVAGSPCQDLSGAQGAARKGVFGQKSRLFFVAIDVLARIQQVCHEANRGKAAEERIHLAWLVENVASMDAKERRFFSKHLYGKGERGDAATASTVPVTLHGELFMPMERKRHLLLEQPGQGAAQRRGATWLAQCTLHENAAEAQQGMCAEGMEAGA